MTREEAKDMLFDAHAEAGVVDAIYDDLESRTCENCKWYDYEIEECLNTYIVNKYTNYLFVEKDFGCNKWESK